MHEIYRSAKAAVENGTASPGGAEEERVLTRRLASQAAAEKLHENGLTAKGARTTNRRVREAKAAVKKGTVSKTQGKRLKSFDKGYSSKRGKSRKKGKPGDIYESSGSYVSN